MIRQEIKKILQDLFPAEKIVVDTVPRGKRGDYSTNLAFLIAARQHTAPMKIASEVAASIKNPVISQIFVEKPGFVNFEIDLDYLLKKLRDADIVSKFNDGQRVLVEFVSANPTGPINIVSARAAAVGDSLVRLLNKVGYDAHSEYYVNDTGKQAEMLALSVYQRLRELKGEKPDIPENGYRGEYLIPLAREISNREAMNTDQLREFSINYFIENHKNILLKFGVAFENWIKESSIHEKKFPETALKKLEKAGKAFEQNGAIFFKATDFGDNRDRVLITSDQRSTYLLNDLGYHIQKIERAYDQLINIWGPDHHGQIKGLQGGIAAMGYPAGIIKIIIIQHVSFKKQGKAVSMSKRAGEIFTLDELIDQVPKDVIRFFFLMRSCSQHLDFDVDLALKQTDENPVYYVQYAHARIKSIIEFGIEQGIDINTEPMLNLIERPEEIALAKSVARFDEILEDSARSFEPFMITYYLLDLARIFHYFYQKVKVVGEDQKLSRARIFLIEKTAQVLSEGLDILGISCPDKM